MTCFALGVFLGEYHAEPLVTGVCRVKGWVKSGHVTTGAAASWCRRAWKAASSSGPQVHLRFFWRSLVSGAVMSAKWVMNLRYHDTIPRNRRSSRRLVGTGIPRIACTLSGSVLTPWAVTMCPKYLSSVRQKSHFSGLIRRLAACSRCRTSRRFCRCSSNVRPRIIMSSKYANARGFQFWSDYLIQ